MEPFFLRSRRLGFRTWTPADLPLALRLWGDEQVTRWIGGPFGEGQVRARLAEEMATQERRGVQYWPMFRLEDDIHVGCGGLRPYGQEPEVLEIGFHVHAEHWGQGYASEAARAVIAHAFSGLGARALFAGHHPRNLSSGRLLQRLGFQPVGEEYYPPTGLLHPSYRLTREALHVAAEEPCPRT